MLRCFASTVEQRPTLLGEAIALAKDVGQLDQVATRRELGHARYFIDRSFFREEIGFVGQLVLAWCLAPVVVHDPGGVATKTGLVAGDC